MNEIMHNTGGGTDLRDRLRSLAPRHCRGAGAPVLRLQRQQEVRRIPPHRSQEDHDAQRRREGSDIQNH